MAKVERDGCYPKLLIVINANADFINSLDVKKLQRDLNTRFMLNSVDGSYLWIDLKKHFTS